MVFERKRIHTLCVIEDEVVVQVGHRPGTRSTPVSKWTLFHLYSFSFDPKGRCVITYEEASLNTSLAQAAAITALVEATAGIIRLTTP
jgi:hypothetical protein